MNHASTPGRAVEPRRRRLSTALGLVAVLGMGGCSAVHAGSGPASGPEPSAQRCQSLLTPPTDRAGLPSVQVVEDASASTFPRGGDGSPGATGSASGAVRPDWAGLLASKVRHDPRALVSYGVFGGRLGPLATVGAPGGSSDPTRDGSDASDFQACLATALRTAFAAEPGSPGTDPLRALADLSARLPDAGKPQRIILMTDGLSNVGCADLRAAQVGDPVAFQRIVDSCGAEIPRLRGVDVTLVGVGAPTAGWPDITTPNRTWLVTLWQKLCEATGAHCQVSSETAAAPTGATPTTPQSSARRTVDDPLVALPAISVRRGDPTVITVPEPLLFAFGSAELTTRATQSIDEIVAQLSALGHSRVEVQGHTDSQGPPDLNQKLSEQRAERVRAALAGRGVRDLTAVGFGDRQPRCRVSIVNRAPNPIDMACNRRVEILAYR